jgi:hypothetical protein
MHWGWTKRHLALAVFRAFVAGSALLLSLTPAAAARAPSTNSAPVTLRCTLNGAGASDTIIQYYIVDSDQKTVSSAGDVYHIGADPNGATGRVITRWSDTEITLINEEWIRNGWQRFRIVTVLDRLTGAIRSEDINSSYTGSCSVADVTKKLF